MEIVFKLATDVVIDEEGPGFKKWQATLTYETDFQKLTFVGTDANKNEALRLAFQAFLDDKCHISQPKFGFRIIPPDDTTVVRVEHFPKEYQDLIWQLIDVKLGRDYLKKITV